MTERGKLYVIEGTDGSGKATQAEKTRQYMSETLGKVVFKTSFPRYGQPSAIMVERILNGEFGTDPENMSLSPEEVALEFAKDRLAGTPEIQAHIEQGENFDAVLDRYKASNLAYHGAKYPDIARRREFYEWISEQEKAMGMLEPNRNVVLIASPQTTHANVAKKDKRDYTDLTHDIHEANIGFQERVKQAYEELCELYPHMYIPIQCTDIEGNMRSVDAIQLDIRKALNI